MNKFLKCFIPMIVGLCVSVTSVSAAQFGVCTHMGLGQNYDNETNVKTAKGSGVLWVRDECRWNNMQNSAGGEFHIRSKDLDYMKQLDKAGINQLLILSYGNTAYANEAEMPSLRNPNYYQNWLKYVRYTVEQVGDYVDAYEVWNEPNLSYFNYELLGTPQDYAQLYLDTRAIVKELDPTAIVLCGAITDVPNSGEAYAEGIFDYIASQGNVNTLIDGFSVHQYTNDPDIAYPKYLNMWEEIFDSYGYTGDVWMTENGVSTETGNNTDTQQAAYVAKIGVQWENYLKTNGRNGVNIWYDLRDDGTDATEYEHNLGLVDYDYNPKESYYAMDAYNRLTADKTIDTLTKIKTKDNWFSDDEYGFSATYVGEHSTLAIVYDTNENKKSTNVALSGDVAYVYNYKGDLTETIHNPSGTKTITMGANPVYVECVTCNTEITNLSYDNENGVFSVAGTTNLGNSITIEVVKDHEVLATKTVTVTNNTFDTWFSFLGTGEYTIRFGYPELTALGATNGWAQEVVTLSSVELAPEIGLSTQVSYNAETRKVTVNGTVSNPLEDQNVTVLAIPKSMDITNIDLASVAYIRQIPVSDGGFIAQFTVPEYFTTDMAIYLGGTGIATVGSLENSIAASDFAYAASLSLEKGNTLSASAYIRNFNETDRFATVMILQYQGNKLVHIDSKPITIPAKTYAPVEFSLDNVSIHSDATLAKAFLWNGLDTMVPLFTVDATTLQQ